MYTTARWARLVILAAMPYFAALAHAEASANEALPDMAGGGTAADRPEGNATADIPGRDAATVAVAGPETPNVTIMGQRRVSEAQQFPATSATITQAQMQEVVNSVDVEDAAKYLPGIFIRKRNYGDTQPVLATRNWGINSSARTLVYVDDIPISALIANNNTIGAPRWGVVSPEQIDRIDMLYGPFAAEYSGNSMGGVMRISTRTPEKTEFTFKQTQALQSFEVYDTDNHYGTSETSATGGGRIGNLSWFIGGNFQNSFSQPLTLVTAASAPAGTFGTIIANNKLGQPADVLGVGGLLHTRMANVIGKVSYDFAQVWSATYLVDFWRNDADSHTTTYLTDATGQSTYGKNAGFASNTYDLVEDHLMNGLSLKSNTRGTWDAEAVVTYYDFLKDRQLSPAGVGAGTQFTPNGRLADLSGTSWGTVDLKGTWRPLGTTGPAEVSFGGHADRYVLINPTNNTSAWQLPKTVGSLFSSGRGQTQTQAIWAQGVWTINSQWQATVGSRVEHWKASQGFNFSGTTGVVQPEESSSAFSPKATLRWRPAEYWTLTGSVARAVRFPTVSELYQLVSTGSTFTSPNPNLEPEKDLSGELAIERALPEGNIRLSLFQENTQDALISQTATLPPAPVPVTYFVNVGEIRNRGIELAAQKADLLIHGLEVGGSVTFVDSTILSNDSFVSTTGTTSEGKHAPYVPRWRATLVTTYHPTARLALTVAGRYSGQMYSTLDNSDNTSHVYGAFDTFLVLDARAHYEITDHISASAGVDNFNNKQYWLFHPFPQRTYVADLRMKF